MYPVTDKDGENMRLSTALLAAALLWTCHATAQQSPVFAERVITTVGSISIEHEPGDTEYVAALKSLFQHFAENGLPPAQRPPFGLAQLQEQRAQVLEQIATLLALPNPTPRLEQTYDGGVQGLTEIREKLRLGMPSRYALWRKDDIKARLRAGQKLEGYELEGDDAAFRMKLEFPRNLDKPREEVIADIDATWAKAVWPVFIEENSPTDAVKQSMRDLFKLKSSAAGTEAMGVLAVLRAAVGESLEASWFAGADARWFQQGLATWLTLEIIEDRVGANDARRYYDPRAVLNRAPNATGTSLEKWVVGDAERNRHSGAFQDANQARATLVIRAIVEAKGEDIIPKLLTELGKQKGRDLPAVYATFGKLTGEDMREYLKLPLGNET